MFKDVPTQLDFPKAEKEILAFWEANKVYEKSLEQRKGGTPFVFFEGPPTANGLPHPGHCLTRAIKDLFPRFKTMTGHYVQRKGGWDTHGLPVEVEVCKELGIHTKEEIEKYGVEAFNRKCLESVFRYTKQWEEMTRRLGFWVNLDEAYVTYHQSYIESVWWSLKQLFDAGLLYQGHKIVWWWAQGGTALSAGEVGQGYREVDDPSVYVRFPLVADDRSRKFIADCGLPIADLEASKISLLVWTTTPWTLPSNMFAAVNKDFDYAIVHDEETGERLLFAAALVEPIAKKVKKTEKWKVEKTVKGSALLDLRYLPPFSSCYYEKSAGSVIPGAPNGPLGQYRAKRQIGLEDFLAWRVVQAPFVTLSAGTGLVHEAPAFGEEDYQLWLHGFWDYFSPPANQFMPCAVAPNGNFTDEGPDYCRGRWVKECDKDIIRDMKDRGLLLHQEQYRHDYPFCWRAEEDPLIQYPRKSWFIRTTQFRDAMLENNSKINWLPEHIKEGRFGNFLRDNVDWSLSRERYWGTPLPIWICESCGQMEAVDSYDALVAKPGIDGLGVWEAAKRQSPELSEHLKVHKPYIDAVTYSCLKCAAGAADQSRDRQGVPSGVSRGSSADSHDNSRSVGQRNAALPDGRGSDRPARMKRVPEVIDCWYDSGAMPFAQWGYPHKNTEMFANQYPADFISEALDQTRGWFYSLVAISTLLFGDKGVARNNPQSAIRNPQYPLPFKNCIVLGLLMGEDGLKMSKSKKNYKEPTYIFDHEGADAMRWLFFSGQTPWTSIRFQESAIAEAQREFLIRLYNCYSFFVIYANIDKWTPSDSRGDPSLAVGALIDARDSKGQRGSLPYRSELDRWILSELAQCGVAVYDAMEAYDNYGAARTLGGFVDALSNWYVRRSRERFWRSDMDDDKRSAYATLHECLVTVSKLIAPFTPFIADSMYQNLVRTHDGNAPISVHLCDYPVTKKTRDETTARVDRAMNEEVELVRQLVSCGRAARSAAKLRVRQPLAAMELHHRRADVIRRHEATIKDELNVKRIEYKDSAAIAEYVTYELKPDFKKLGPKHGPLAPKIKAALGAMKDVGPLVKSLEASGACSVTVDGREVQLTTDEVLVELHAKEGFAADRIAGQGIVVLDTHLTPELLDEGLARDMVNQIQQARKSLDLRYEQRVDLAIVGDADVSRVVNAHATYIRNETLAQSLLCQPIRDVEPVRAEIEGREVNIFVRPI
jgi:isoleucyl-tRNA synthetase